MLATFTDIIINKQAERGFTRRALSACPKEYIEALWGKIRGERLYVMAFMPFEHCATNENIYYKDNDDAVLDESEDEAAEEGMRFLGTIHTHPYPYESTTISSGDINGCQDSNEIVMGVMSISLVKGRRRTAVNYWPCPRPLRVTYR